MVAGLLIPLALASFALSPPARAVCQEGCDGDNTFLGTDSLVFNDPGGDNTATGAFALFSNTEGDFNTANGTNALFSNTTGSANIAVGYNAGFHLTTGGNNIDIGNNGEAAESDTIRIGTGQTRTFIAGISGATVTGTPVVVNANGQLGVAPSSERFKEAVKPIDKASEAILALKPVTFRYKHELDPEGIPQFGLVAEEVEKVKPDLVARDEQGKPYTVRYEAVNAVLLNEFLKEHRKVTEQQGTIGELKVAVAQQQSTNTEQQKAIKSLTAALKEQAAQIQKVSAELEARKSSPQIVLNNQ
jgi:uncharacterized coiled-coil protein SlyX